MKKAEAERLIVEELRIKFASSPPSAGMGGIIEYQQLKNERPELFQFRHAGDQWQVVSGWINKHRLLER